MQFCESTGISTVHTGVSLWHLIEDYNVHFKLHSSFMPLGFKNENSSTLCSCLSIKFDCTEMMILFVNHEGKTNLHFVTQLCVV